MTITFNESISPESVIELIEKLDSVLHDNPDEIHTLYFSTEGGQSAATSLLIDYLNSHSSSLYLKAFDSLHSNGLDVYYNFKGSKLIVENTTCLLHLKSCNLNTSEIKNNDFNYKNVEKDLDKSNKDYLKMLKKIKVSDKIIRKVAKGKDIILYYEQFKKLKL